MFSTDDTIAAIATPPGRGGIGVVRVSGPQAHRVVCALTGHDRTGFAPRYATLAHVHGGGNGSGTPADFDQVLCTYFPAPHSYTGEDVVEISAHGSPVVLARLVAEATRLGARLARPGEFTFRAYLHGRIDLVQAEAVADLVDAVTPAQARLAFDQLQGTLTQEIRVVEHTVFDLVLRLEASLDFPEENYHFISTTEAAERLGEVRTRLEAILGGAGAGRMIREGAHVVISGRPNVGKSSLFNRLLGVERAIVTAIPGTTRDLLTERCDVGGVPTTLVDTAGMREPDDPVEVEGVHRARHAAEVADLRLVVLDRSEPLTPEDLQIIDAVGDRPHVVAANKSDLPSAWPASGVGGRAEVVEVSANTGAGVDLLRRTIAVRLGAGESLTDSPRISNLRHIRLLEQALDAVDRAVAAAVSGASEEFLLADLKDVSLAFEQVVGTRSAEDVLEGIFSRFCIGK